MKPRPIGLVGGIGGPLGVSTILQKIVQECKNRYLCLKSHEYPCLSLFSYPYSQLPTANFSNRTWELDFSVEQLKRMGAEIVVIPCFTMSSFLSHRNYGIELIEMGSVLVDFLEEKKIEHPLILCTERTRESGYCDQLFPCHYPSKEIQSKVDLLIDRARAGEQIDLKPLLSLLPGGPIVGACSLLNLQSLPHNDSRYIDPTYALAKAVVTRSFEGTLGESLDEATLEEMPPQSVVAI